MLSRIKLPLWAVLATAFLAAPAFGQGQPVKLSLADAVARTLGASTKVKQAEHDLSRQVERRRGAWSDVGPRVKAEYADVRFHDAQTAQFGPQEITLRPKETKVGSLTAYQPITGAFALVEKARFEGAQEDLKDAALRMTRTEVAFQTAETYLKAYEADEQLNIAVQSINAVDTQRKDGEALERAGRMNHGDVLKLELSVSEAKARAAQARSMREISFAVLRQALDLPVDAPIELDGKLPDVPEQAPDQAQALQQAATQRLELIQARTGVEVASFGKKLAYTNFTPSVNLFAKVERNFGEVTGLGRGDKDTHSYGLQATWDLWNNGSHVFAVREAAEQTYKAEEAARGVDQLIKLDVLTALSNLKAARESLALAKVAVNQAGEAYRIEKVRFKTGTRSATDLIFAETSESGAKGRLVSARSDLVLWNLRVQKALGVEQPKL